MDGESFDKVGSVNRVMYEKIGGKNLMSRKKVGGKGLYKTGIATKENKKQTKKWGRAFRCACEEVC